LTSNSIAGARDYERWLEQPEGSVGVIENGIDLVAFRSTAEAKDTAVVYETLGLPPETDIVGGCMRMTQEKRPLLWLESAIEIVKRHHGVHFVCIGEGPLKPEMERRISEEGLSARIHLPGQQVAVGAWLSVFDILVNCSVVEGMPNVVIEAQSLGIPVIATDVGGTRETLVDGESGILVAADNRGALVAAIHTLLNDPQKRSRFGEAGKLHATGKFSIDAMLNKTLEVYAGA